MLNVDIDLLRKFTKYLLLWISADIFGSEWSRAFEWLYFVHFLQLPINYWVGFQNTTVTDVQEIRIIQRAPVQAKN